MHVRQLQARTPEPGVQAGRILAFDQLRRDPFAARVIELVARARDVPVVLILHPSRCSAEVAEARQLAMYLVHVVLQRSYDEVGLLFGRDRTTVAHGCALIEDRRDDKAFDQLVEQLSAQIEPGDAYEEPSRAAG